MLKKKSTTNQTKKKKIDDWENFFKLRIYKKCIYSLVNVLICLFFKMVITFLLS